MAYSLDPEHNALLTLCLEDIRIAVCFTPNRLPGGKPWMVSNGTLTLSWREHRSTADLNASMRAALEQLYPDVPLPPRG